VLAERAIETERLRRIPDETVNDFREAGLLRTANPKRFGSYGLDHDTVLEIAAMRVANRQLEPTDAGYLLHGACDFSSGADAAQWARRRIRD
jgi:GTP cyclohydrolase II